MQAQFVHIVPGPMNTVVISYTASMRDIAHGFARNYAMYGVRVVLTEN
jgi:hypothetical protein